MSSLSPQELAQLGKRMSAGRAQKLLDEFDESSLELAGKIGKVEVIKYLDDIERIEAPPLKKLADAIGKGEVARFLYYVDNHKYLEDYTGPEDLWDMRGSVLLKPYIEKLCDKNNVRLPLIDPLDPDKDSRDAASYKLRLGSQYRVKGKQGWLSKSDPKLTIPPHGIAIVSTFEWVNIPRFLIARWNLRVSKVYEGLVWVGSLQVDPGYQGFLSCPLYNLSKEPQVIEYGKGLFTIDFVVTTPFDKSTGCKIWDPPDKLTTFDFSRLDKKKIESAPEYLQKQVIECQDEIGNFKKEISNLKGETRTTEFFGAVLLTIIVAALGIIVIFSGGTGTSSGAAICASNTCLKILACVALAISLISVGISLIFRKRGR